MKRALREVRGERKSSVSAQLTFTALFTYTHPKWVALNTARCSGGCWKHRGWKAEISTTCTKRKSGWNYTRNRTCLLMKQPWSSVIIFKEAAKIKVKGVSQWLQVCTALKNTPSVQSTPPPPFFAHPIFLSFTLFLLYVSLSFLLFFQTTGAAL